MRNLLATAVFSLALILLIVTTLAVFANLSQARNEANHYHYGYDAAIKHLECLYRTHNKRQNGFITCDPKAQ
jgi:hypothetical protein